ncbi:FadR/GntR family transcriptional regulator [Kineosporia succinea]|uniref:DNA-binding FadR family transcriptional regulator n=1 Tax=Kineosporia succinea TaxID=84632 RepID=A0ABT9P915_9ACTN|nr:GntR family transcriptional regulator [Kineosporia succinea]MDP9829192.1 DNA-binding FadR family transcriptional regulator [Kineosporia succinea]
MSGNGPRPLEYERVAEELRQMIVAGDLRPGDRLPPEGELTARMRVSRGTLREALRVLSAQKLLTSSRGVNGGTFIAEPSPDDVADYLQTSLTLLSRSRLSVGQLLEVRSQLEVPAAELAARRRSDEDLRRLSERVAGDCGDEFHLVLLQAAGNPLIDMMARPVFSVLRERFAREQAGAGFWERVAAEHAEILQHVRERNGRAAGRVMRAHLSGLRETYTRIDATRLGS